MKFILTTLAFIVMTLNMQAPQAMEKTDDTLVITETGVTMLDIPAFKNGTVSFDLKMKSGRAFTGILFRAENTGNSELVYIRHHQQGKPDAWQYHPRYNGHQAYQIYQGDGFSGIANVKMDNWIHVELTLKNEQAVLKIDGEAIAAMPNLQREPIAGKLGIWALREERILKNITVSENSEALNEPLPKPVPPRPITGLIQKWSVSHPLPKAEADKGPSPDFQASHTVLKATHRGIVDLNQIAPLTTDADTVFASVILTSETKQTAFLDLGFSDHAAVWLNGALVYKGSDVFRSRDYRFLGTVGFYDQIPLRLAPGRNELSIAVTEQEGGWAISGKLDAPDQVTINPLPN